jgi:hypothetical protein
MHVGWRALQHCWKSSSCLASRFTGSHKIVSGSQQTLLRKRAKSRELYSQSACLVSLGNARDADCLPIYRIKTVSKPLLLSSLRLSAERKQTPQIVENSGKKMEL